MQIFHTSDNDRGFDVLGSTSRGQAAMMTLPAGDSTGGPDNKHDASDQWLFVISGRGEATIAGEDITFERGDLVLIEAGETHEIRNAGDQPLRTINF